MSEFNGPHDVYGHGFPQAKPEPKSLWAKALERNQPVPRVASSLDDLRVGQVVAYADSDETGCRWYTVRLTKPSQIREFDTTDLRDGIVILSDAEPEPVSVSRAAVDRLAEAFGNPLRESVRSAAAALLAEVRAQEPTP